VTSRRTFVTAAVAEGAPGSTIFVLGSLDPFEAVATLDERRLHIDEHVRDGHPALRIATHYYNPTGEVDARSRAWWACCRPRRADDGVAPRSMLGPASTRSTTDLAATARTARRSRSSSSPPRSSSPAR